jgi:murein DD-endopeptidase MepM/ murein hydrolase activator NlpD
VGGCGVLVLVALVVTVPGLAGRRGAQAGATAVRAAAFRRPAASLPVRSGGIAPASRDHAATAARNCQPVAASSGYVNPLAGAVVTGERIDQGVDYAGSGTLAALGAGRVTYVGTSATGWPGAFIEYQLADGPDAGCYVFYAEGVNPVRSLRVGQTVEAGQTLATIIPGWPTGVELGWGAGTNTITYAAKTHHWSPRSDAGNIASQAGKTFSALVASLGGPAGKVEG